MLAGALSPLAVALSLSAALSQWLARELGVQLQAMEPVSGGCIHRSWCLRLTDGSRLFAKTNQARLVALLEAERAGLEALSAWTDPPLRLPRPLALGTVAGHAVLVLSWLALDHSAGAEHGVRTEHGVSSKGGWASLGRALARLHRKSRHGNGGRGYGFDGDNYIGALPQVNRWSGDWAQFFAASRLLPQSTWARAAGHPLHGLEQLLAELPARIGSHGVEPVLVHGDLWRGNAGLLCEGEIALFDPACYWADREVDLAMARLFGGFPEGFFLAYEEEWPLPEGAADRMPVYNLYHLINHANLFGGGYWQQAQSCLNALLSQTS